MYSFKDSAGRSWTIALNYGTIQRVHAEIGFNLRQLVDGDEENPLQPCFDFISDPIMFGPVLLAILAPDLKAANVTPEQFLETLDGDAAYAAGQAFARRYVDFFHAAKKAALHKQMDKAAAVTTAAMEIAVQKMDLIDLEAVKAKMEAEFDAHVAKLSKTSSGNVPESAA